jgi:hypothetical protein
MSSIQYYVGTLRSLIGLQLVSRLASFGLNQSLIRIASPTVYGTAAIQFDLIRDTILFLGREAVRGVVLRTRVTDDDEKAKGTSPEAKGTSPGYGHPQPCPQHDAYCTGIGPARGLHRDTGLLIAPTT